MNQANLLPAIPTKTPTDQLNYNLKELDNYDIDIKVYEFLRDKIISGYSVKAIITGTSFRSLCLTHNNSYEDQKVTIIQL